MKPNDMIQSTEQHIFIIEIETVFYNLANEMK